MALINSGRMQAQGGGTQESVPWNSDTPPSDRRGHEMLNELAGKLTPRERQIRVDAFSEAHKYVNVCASAGGADASTRRILKSFPQSNRIKGGVRVDVEVNSGRAFIPERE